MHTFVTAEIIARYRLGYNLGTKKQLNETGNRKSELKGNTRRLKVDPTAIIG